MNPTKQISIEKITLNIGAGKDQALLEKGHKLIKKMSGIDPIKCITKKRIPAWGLRPGLPIGVKITIRDKVKIKDLVSRCVKARDGKLPESCFDNGGNVSFGIHEYIDVPGVDYDPEIGIIGFQISITLKRPGYGIAKSISAKKVGAHHKITHDEAIEFMSKEFGVEAVSKEVDEE